MSEIIDFYKARMPEKCLTCPLFVAAIMSAEAHEADAQNATNVAVEIADNGVYATALFYPELHTAVSQLVELTTDGEIDGIKRVAQLAKNGSICPTPKRGGVPGETTISSIVSWLENNKVCRNPGIKDFMQL